MTLVIDKQEIKAIIMDLQESMVREIPGFKMKEKQVLGWKVVYYISFMWLWNKKFLTSYWTTIGKTVYVPNLKTFGRMDLDAFELMGDYATLFHERRHMLDLQALEKRLSKPLAGLLWVVGYGSPQILGLAALGAIWGSWWWLLCLLLAAPWPAPFRVAIERRGYLASTEAWIKLTQIVPTPDDAWLQGVIDRNFLGWNYYRMSWSREAEVLWFTGAIDELQGSLRPK